MTIFEKASETEVTRAIVSQFSKDIDQFADMDVIIVGSGPSGLMAARDLAKNGVRVLILERNNYLGGGFWMGGFLMNTITIRSPANRVLDELEIPYEKYSDSIYTTLGPLSTSKLIASTIESGAKILNMTMFDDVVLREKNRVGGVVVNWTPVSTLPRAISCIDPIAFESKIVIDGTGHEAQVVQKLAKRNLIKAPGEGGMWIEASEEAVVEKSGWAHPGLIVIGMAVATTFGLPRMGPTFGSMLLSGRKGAQIALEELKKK